MKSKGMYSIVVEESQFYNKDYDFDVIDDNMYYSEPSNLVDFKKRCTKAFGKSAVIQYGGGQIEIIVSEDNFAVFQQIADDFDIDFDIGDIVDM